MADILHFWSLIGPFWQKHGKKIVRPTVHYA